MPLSVSPSAATPALRSSASGLAAFAVPSATATAFALTPTPVLNGLKTAASPIPLNSVPGSTLPAAAADGAVRAKIAGAAKAFETQFLSVMIGQMFEGVDTPAPFGGGSGEKAFKSFLTDAFARSIADHGGVGLAAPVARSMLKLQGLSA